MLLHRSEAVGRVRVVAAALLEIMSPLMVWADVRAAVVPVIVTGRISGMTTPWRRGSCNPKCELSLGMFVVPPLRSQHRYGAVLLVEIAESNQAVVAIHL